MCVPDASDLAWVARAVARPVFGRILADGPVDTTIFLAGGNRR
jgi:hypothetical protein